MWKVRAIKDALTAAQVKSIIGQWDGREETREGINRLLAEWRPVTARMNRTQP